MNYVYILESLKDMTHYVGHTSDLKNRLKEHNNKESKFSSSKAPYKLKWYCAFESKEKAISFERYLKHGSGFAFSKKHLI